MDTPTVRRRLRADVTVTEELDAGLAASPPPVGQSESPVPPRPTPEAGTANVIHTAEGARDYGYQGALVAGVLLFGWCVPAVVEVLGPEWITSGWAQVSFRRPVYSGTELDLRVEPRPTPAAEAGLDDGTASVELASAEGSCVEGQAGLGPPSWSGEIADLPRRSVEPALTSTAKPHLTLATPAGDLRTLDATVGSQAAMAFGRSQPEPMEVFCAERPAVHPAILARQMISLLGHTYDYGRPSIHVSTQLENLARVPAEEPLSLSGRLMQTYERRGHHYAVTDGVLYGDGPEPLARLRHTNIFRLARRDPN